jgi:hypothetical protein
MARSIQLEEGEGGWDRIRRSDEPRHHNNMTTRVSESDVKRATVKPKLTVSSPHTVPKFC